MGAFGVMQAGFILLLIIIGGGITLFVLFHLTLQRTMDAVSEKNRQMSGGSVWLNLIPVFNLVFPFIFNNALKNSIELEYFDRKITKPVSLGSGVVLYPLMILVSIFFSVLFYNSGDVAYSLLSSLAGIVNIVGQIVFWTQVANHKRMLLGQSQQQQQQNQQQQYFQQPLHTSPTTKYCGNCKNQIPIHDNFCLICGFDMRVNYQTPVHPPQPPQSPQPQAIYEEQISPASNVQNNSVPTNENKETKIDKLSKYYDMLQQDLITKEDFDRIKKELL